MKIYNLYRIVFHDDPSINLHIGTFTTLKKAYDEIAYDFCYFYITKFEDVVCKEGVHEVTIYRMRDDTEADCFHIIEDVLE